MSAYICIAGSRDGKFEFAVRQDLESKTPRGLAVLKPLKVTVTTWPAELVEELDLAWWPGEPERGGSRKVPFGRELFIEEEDFSGPQTVRSPCRVAH